MRIAVLSVFGLLAACSAEREPEAAPSPTPTMAVPRTLVAADLDLATLGARVEGIEVADRQVGEGLANVTAFVACPKAMTVCDPGTAPQGTVYTYVLTITPPGTPGGPVTTPVPSPTGTETPVTPIEAPAELVRMIRPAPGFDGAVGFVRAEATAALGEEGALTVTLDENRLIWRVTGGTGWAAGMPITLWWQSTRPPEKGGAAYRLEYAGKRADIDAPFPADKPVERGAAR